MSAKAADLWRHRRHEQHGFTLMELLIVVAIVGTLVAIAIPMFVSQLERSREATDLANARSAYAAVMTAGMTEDATATQGGSTVRLSNGSYRMVVSLRQQQDDWQTDSASLNVGGITPESENWIGTPKANGRCTVTYNPSTSVVTLNWSGANNDLSTSSGRRQEDIDNMHAIADALLAAVDDGSLRFTKNYVQVAVLADGTMTFYDDCWDGRGNEPERTQKIRDALEAAGLPTTAMEMHSTDSSWRYGYIVHVGSNGSVTYKKAPQDNDGNAVWWWWNTGNITDEDVNASE